METAAPTTESTGSQGSSAPPPAPKASEFSKPIGAKDDEVWERHFGKGSEERKVKTGKGDSKDSERSSRAPSKESESRSARSSKDSSTSMKERSESSTKTSKDAPSRTESSKSPERKSTSDSKSSDKDQATGKAKTTEQQTPSEAKTKPEAESAKEPGKAKDLYRKAVDEKDPKAARKLYREAMVEAFGEVPREFDETQWAVARKKQAEAEATIERGKKETEARIADAVKQLEPAVYTMRQLNDAGLGSLSAELVQQTVSVMKALRAVEDGDFTALGDVIAKAAKRDPDEAMKLYVKGVKVSPEGRAARQAAERAQAEARAAQEKLQALERKLEEQRQAETKAAQEAQVAQKREEYLDRIETELDGHPVLKLPRGRERVLAYLIKTANKALKAPRYSFEEAADRVVNHERKRLRELAGALGEGGDPEPAATPGKTPVRAVPRSEAHESGVHDESPDAKFSRIFDKHMSAGGGRRR